MAYVTVAERELRSTMLIIGLGIFIGFIVGLVGLDLVQHKYFKRMDAEEVLFQEFQSKNIQNIPKNLQKDFDEWIKNKKVQEQISKIDEGKK
ncbi:MAG: hypothetical protein IBX44_00040 [Sulfurospirillum sp.]|nr:hypothetical protein [Sulfurospirillum sp.]